MASSPIMVAPQRALEDALAHLPRTAIAEYGKGKIIYDRSRPPTGMYLIISGSVSVCRIASDGRQVVADIYRRDEFFGESALLGEPYSPEQATAFENAKVMAWTAAEIEEIAARRPRLGVALWQVLAQRTVDCGHRIESFSVDDVARRLARSLIRFSDRLGTPRDDGSIRIPALTHSFLSQYVGTSREVVTAYMIHFRRQGYIRYSRTEMTVAPEAFKDWLRKDAGVIPRMKRGRRSVLCAAIREMRGAAEPISIPPPRGLDLKTAGASI